MSLRSFVTALLVLVIAGVSFSVRAEGGCPPGQYPIGGQGVVGCAPMNGGGRSVPAPPRPTGEWLKTWGAISTSPTTGAAGVSVGKMSKREALADARAQCGSKGAPDCTPGFSYENQCMALVDPPAHSGRPSGISSAGTVKEAVRLATETCERAGGGCAVAYSACTEPVFRRF